MGALVVVDAGDRLVGIVTDRDLVVRGLVRRADPQARVDSVMTTDLVVLPADADLRDALVTAQVLFGHGEPTSPATTT